MKKMTYNEHLRKWKRSMQLVRKHNERLIEEWQSIPWWKFWVQRPSIDEQLRIVRENWSRFEQLPIPRMSDYFPLKRWRIQTIESEVIGMKKGGKGGRKGC